MGLYERNFVKQVSFYEFFVRNKILKKYRNIRNGQNRGWIKLQKQLKNLLLEF